MNPNTPLTTEDYPCLDKVVAVFKGMIGCRLHRLCHQPHERLWSVSPLFANTACAIAITSSLVLGYPFWEDSIRKETRSFSSSSVRSVGRPLLLPVATLPVLWSNNVDLGMLYIRAALEMLIPSSITDLRAAFIVFSFQATLYCPRFTVGFELTKQLVAGPENAAHSKPSNIRSLTGRYCLLWKDAGKGRWQDLKYLRWAVVKYYRAL